MKTLIFLSLLTLSTTAFSAELVCGALKAGHKRTYPINQEAISFFSELGLKACTGTTARERIRAAVEAAKHTVDTLLMLKPWAVCRVEIESEPTI